MMMRNFLLVLSFACLAFVPSVVSAQSEGIAVVVNDDAITLSEVNSRMNLIIRSSGMPDNPEMRDKLRPQVIDALIEEQLKLQEGERQELKVTEGEIQQGFAQLAQQNNRAPEEFKEMIGKSGININTMYRQIKSQLMWGKVVTKVVRPSIKVTAADLDDAFQRQKDNFGKAEYQVAEIFLPVESQKEAQNIRELAGRLSSDINAGKVPFFRVAQQFSKSAGAGQGGDLGWVQQGQLAEELEQALAGMQQGQVSAPIRSQSGYHILLLREKRVISEETLPSEEEMMNIIGTQRLERMQRRHLQDLKTAAFIENRV